MPADRSLPPIVFALVPFGKNLGEESGAPGAALRGIQTLDTEGAVVDEAFSLVTVSSSLSRIHTRRPKRSKAILMTLFPCVQQTAQFSGRLFMPVKSLTIRNIVNSHYSQFPSP